MKVYLVLDGYHPSGGCSDSYEIVGIYRNENDADKKRMEILQSGWDGKYSRDSDYYCIVEEHDVIQ